MLILLDAIISLTLRIADIVSAIFDIEVACQPSQRQKYIARTEGQSRLDAPSQPFSAMITDGSDSCITIKLIFIRCRMPHTLCVFDFSNPARSRCAHSRDPGRTPAQAGRRGARYLDAHGPAPPELHLPKDRHADARRSHQNFPLSLRQKPPQRPPLRWFERSRRPLCQFVSVCNR